MAKKSGSKGFLWGIILGAILATAAIYYYQHYYNQTNLQRSAKKIEKNAENGVNKAQEGVKKLFDKKQ